MEKFQLLFFENVISIKFIQRFFSIEDYQPNNMLYIRFYPETKKFPAIGGLATGSIVGEEEPTKLENLQ